MSCEVKLNRNKSKSSDVASNKSKVPLDGREWPKCLSAKSWKSLVTSDPSTTRRFSESAIIPNRTEEDRRRKTIIIERKNSSFGFTLQTYGIHHRKEGEIELLTYVDKVDQDGPAYRAGMRPGDVILSINGEDMEKADHRTLVKCIQSCPKTMRMVVLFEDCVRKVELHMKYLKLKKVLQEKVTEYERLTERENQLIAPMKTSFSDQFVQHS